MTIEQVKEFHESFGHPVAPQVQLVDKKTFELRRRLIKEELEETIRDYHKGDFVKTVDGLADLLVVIHGSILVYGGLEGVSALREEDHGDTDWGDYGLEPPLAIPVMPEIEEFVRFAHHMYSNINKMSVAESYSNVYKVLTALIDMREIVLDMFETHDIPLKIIEDAVHTANMSKLGEDGRPIYRESDGKILKGPNFRPPEEDIEAILKEHGAKL